MIVTESEARDLRCCGPQTCGETRGVQRLDSVTPVSNMALRFCIASKCMAWRWKPSENGSVVGWCGLAGKAETDGR